MLDALGNKLKVGDKVLTNLNSQTYIVKIVKITENGFLGLHYYAKQNKNEPANMFMNTIKVCTNSEESFEEIMTKNLQIVQKMKEAY